jgi:NAD(P)-dependent dehydrogenase (short-subunit alcohol dehydrogenase family)
MNATTHQMTGAKIALVTGGNRGLGRDMALRITWGGLDLLITYRTQKDARRINGQRLEVAGGIVL